MASKKKFFSVFLGLLFCSLFFVKSSSAYNDTMISAYLGSVQSISSDSYTKVLFDSVNYDAISEFSNSKFTVKHNGYYRINSSVTFETSVDGKPFGLSIYKNGSKITETYLVTGNSSDWNNIYVDNVLYLIAGDYVEIYAYQNSGISMNLYNSSSQSFINIYKINDNSDINVDENIVNFYKLLNQSIYFLWILFFVYLAGYKFVWQYMLHGGKWSKQ